MDEMRFDRKSCSTTMEESPISARPQILPSTRLKAGSSLGSCSQSVRRVVGAAVGSTNCSWVLVYTRTQSSIQCSHLPGLRVRMYLEGPLVWCWK
jgi:hypothetical protein